MRQITSLGHAEAQRAMAAIQQQMEQRGQAGVIAVADQHGELIGLLRLDGAPLASILIATNKAWTAARERRPSKEIGQRARDPLNGFEVDYYGDSRYLGWGGGVPVWLAGEVVGAVAVSGLPEPDDMALAQLGADTILAAAAG